MHDLAYFCAGILLTNAIPHFVSGVMGRPFQSPFATPSGVGLSSSITNVLWGFANAAIGTVLLTQLGDFTLNNPANAIALGAGILLMALVCARLFGRFHGGANPS